MKPNFALNFTDTSVALLHRTAKGWLKVGETPFDAPDFDGALDYLRKTALELEPGGFATKLVIPNEQVLYTTLEVPTGPEAARRAALAVALEGATPYSANEIAFDWHGDGIAVSVAAVARETLDEAEGFATAHRFNPIGFVAIPPAGEEGFAAEPWFGTTSAGAALEAEGTGIERDAKPISILGEGGRGTKPRGNRKAKAPAPAAASSQRAPAPADPSHPAAPSAAAPPPGPEEATVGPDALQDAHADAAPGEARDSAVSQSPEAAPADTVAVSVAVAPPPEDTAADDAEPEGIAADGMASGAAAPPAPDAPPAAEAEPDPAPAPRTDPPATVSAPVPPPRQSELRFAEPDPLGPRASGTDKGASDRTAQVVPPSAPHGSGPALAVSGIEAVRVPVEARVGADRAPILSADAGTSSGSPGGSPGAAPSPTPTFSAPRPDAAAEFVPPGPLPATGPLPAAEPPAPAQARPMDIPHAREAAVRAPETMAAAPSDRPGTAPWHGTAAEDEVEEAPFAHIPDDLPGDTPLSAPIREISGRPLPPVLAADDDDLPPEPSSAVLAALATARREAGQRETVRHDAPSRPQATRPLAAEAPPGNSGDGAAPLGSPGFRVGSPGPDPLAAAPVVAAPATGRTPVLPSLT
ncbi:hypothetical protein ABNX41_11235, partial [Rhodobacteraceae bacterium PA1-206B]